jgi:cellulose binding protein with CBM2 domain
MRRVVVTPTFAAGLGVVVAAVLAYPMQTVFSYVVPGASGQGGLVCTQAGCTNHSGRGKPYPFGVGDGAFPSSPGSAEPGNVSPGQHAGGGGATAQPRLTYKVTGRWQGGFWGRITITFPGAPPPQWRLRIGYPGRHIQRIKPSGHLAPGGHGALVRSTDYSGGWGPGDRMFTVGLSVRDRPARPGSCWFNGRRCHFS